MKFTFLGTGTSVGVPVIGCECPVCQSDNPKNHRTRSSLYIESNNQKFVIDTSTDFRTQCLREGIDYLDFILFTHAHADHIGGLDDIRPITYTHDQSIPAYGNEDTLRAIRNRFDYIFEPTPNDSWKPEVDLKTITDSGIPKHPSITPIPVEHGEINILGYRIGSLAYLCDVSHIPPNSVERLEHLDVLIIDALRKNPHPTHLTIDQAVNWAEKINPRRTFFTHMTHKVEYEKCKESLPKTIQPAYDGLSLEL